MSTYDSVKIVPLLHRNAINFIGMKPRSEYLTYREIQDRVIALDKEGILTTWSIQTGKILEQHNLSKTVDLSDYEVYQSDETDCTYFAGWYLPRVLLVNRRHPVKVDESSYFGDRVETSLINSIPYVTHESKKFLRYKVIDIKSTSQIEELISFVHVNYQPSVHKIFFS
jgi:hypothetical protein